MSLITVVPGIEFVPVDYVPMFAMRRLQQACPDKLTAGEVDHLERALHATKVRGVRVVSPRNTGGRSKFFVAAHQAYTHSGLNKNVVAAIHHMNLLRLRSHDCGDGPDSPLTAQIVKHFASFSRACPPPVPRGRNGAKKSTTAPHVAAAPTAVEVVSVEATPQGITLAKQLAADMSQVRDNSAALLDAINTNTSVMRELLAIWRGDAASAAQPT